MIKGERPRKCHVMLAAGGGKARQNEQVAAAQQVQSGSDAIGDDLISRHRQVRTMLLRRAERQHADRLARDAAQARRIEFNPLHAVRDSMGR
jgi:hypothetical protein